MPIEETIEKVSTNLRDGLHDAGQGVSSAGQFIGQGLTNLANAKRESNPLFDVVSKLAVEELRKRRTQ